MMKPYTANRAAAAKTQRKAARRDGKQAAKDAA